jgi:hypothetical protein
VKRGPAAEAEEPELSVSSRRRVARRAKEEPKTKSSAPLMIVVLLVLGVGGAVAWKKLNPPPPPPSAPDPSVVRAKELGVMFQEGKNLVRAGKWAEAKAKFQTVFDEQPELGDGAVKTYLAACEKEIPNQKRFDEAMASLQKGEVGPAQRALNAVTADTQQLQRRDEVQAKQAEVFKLRAVEARDLATSPGDLVKMKRLKAVTDDMLVARPDDRDALELKAVAERALHHKDGPVVELPKDDPGLAVQKRYALGDMTGAATAAAECTAAAASCGSLASKLEELSGLLKRLEALQGNELDRALRLDREIAGSRSGSPQGKQIITRIGAVYYPKASAARGRGDWQAAMEFALKVVDADAGHAGAGAIVAEGKEKARDLYLRCYTQRAASPEEAVPLCNEAIKMLPPGDDTRTKAEKVLEGMRTR